MKKHLLLVITLIIFSIGAIPSYCQIENISRGYQTYEALQSINLLKTFSNTDFALEKPLLRHEAIVIYVEFLGQQESALTGYWSHPFTDVPTWAYKHVAYAYELGYIKGLSESKLGIGEADANTFLTYMLRSLGYSDENGQDFTYDNPYDLAKEIGILTDQVNIENFLRADAVIVAANTLRAPLKDTDRPLSDVFLYQKNMFTDKAYANARASFYRTYDLIDQYTNFPAIDYPTLMDQSIPPVENLQLKIVPQWVESSEGLVEKNISNIALYWDYDRQDIEDFNIQIYDQYNQIVEYTTFSFGSDYKDGIYFTLDVNKDVTIKTVIVTPIQVKQSGDHYEDIFGHSSVLECWYDFVVVDKEPIEMMYQKSDGEEYELIFNKTFEPFTNVSLSSSILNDGNFEVASTRGRTIEENGQLENVYADQYEIDELYHPQNSIVEIFEYKNPSLGSNGGRVKVLKHPVVIVTNFSENSPAKSPLETTPLTPDVVETVNEDTTINTDTPIANDFVTAFGDFKVISSKDLPRHIEEQLVMNYPDALIHELRIQFFNTITNETTWFDFINEEVPDFYLDMESPLIIDMYLMTMVSKDRLTEVNAHYDNMVPDDYLTSMQDDPYPFFIKPGGEGGHFAITTINPTTKGVPQMESTMSKDFDQEGYITFIHAGCEWIRTWE